MGEEDDSEDDGAEGMGMGGGEDAGLCEGAIAKAWPRVRQGQQHRTEIGRAHV